VSIFPKLQLGILLSVSSLCCGALWVLADAYQAPPPTPPTNNVPASVTVDDSTDIKSGNFRANIVAAATSTWSPRYCDAFGNNCFTAASRGAGSRVTQLQSGHQDLLLAPNMIVGTGTISVNPGLVQRRILACPAGQVIRQINIDGTVVCEPTTTSCFYRGNTFPAGQRCRVAVSSCGTGTMYYYKTCVSGVWMFGSQCTISTLSIPSC
jgi:hypothetical protein